MENFAVIKTGGKQYQVKEGDTLKVEKLEVEVGQNIRFDQVLLHYEAKTGVRLGEPFLEGEAVEAEVLEEVKGEKIVVFTYKAKKHEKKKKGHRQRYTLVKIIKVGNAAEKPKTMRAPSAVKKEHSKPKSTPSMRSAHRGLTPTLRRITQNEDKDANS